MKTTIFTSLLIAALICNARSQDKPVITQQPASETAVVTNTPFTLSVVATGATTYQWFRGGVKLLGETSDTFSVASASSLDSGTYRVVVGNGTNADKVTSSNAVVIVGYPVTITMEPSNVATVAGQMVALHVKATGYPAPKYYWQINGSNVTGNVTGNSATLQLGPNRDAIAGSYDVIVSNAFGAVPSDTVTVMVVPRTTSVLTITTVGSGTYVPNLNGKELVVGKSYTLVALPGKGQYFAGWSGSAASTGAILNFTMQPEMALTASFVANPYTNNSLAGVYNGLFWDAENPSETDAGFLTLTLASDGIFAGQISLDGNMLTFGKRFDADGMAQFTVPRPHKGDLSVTLTLDLRGSNGLTGTISSVGVNGTGAFNANNLQAYRVFFDARHRATDFNGRYTLAMNGAGNGDPTVAPQGYSYGTADVTGGDATESLNLSDGTAITVPARGLSENGYLPLYEHYTSARYGSGTVIGWVLFSNTTASTNYSIFWFKNAGGSPHFTPYTNGFSLTGRTIWLDPYKVPAKGTNGVNALDTTDAQVQLAGADLVGTLTDAITLNAKGVSSGANNDNVSVSIANGTGLFTGSFTDPMTGNTLRFRGAVLESTAAGYGYFLTTDTTPNDLSGSVVVVPVPAAAQ